jgi:1-acyl-sn-glycerol-3-phosphate acyltransferase
MEPWHYDPARDLEQPLLERLRNFPREPDMLVYGLRTLAALAMRGWLQAYHRFAVAGRENLPRDRSFVMVANHASHLDALSLLAALPLGKVHRAFPAAARDYFFETAPRVFLAAVVVNALPFDRQARGRQSLSICWKVLENPGNILIIFPEGTRSTTGDVADFKPGIGLLVAGTEHPVVPCYLQGAHRAWPKGAIFPRPRALRLTIGVPRTFSHLSRGKEAAVAISRELREAVVSLKSAAAASAPPLETAS